ncbi:hypothetical protein H6F90_03735 [Trichocoleus sp. FACHB-591]|uniref:hypothetical protein n=1 Tax=Trichocoleus sp. FACHB-591 TaxID=2692872 RepID=UPI001684DBD7|nr:hypothetical protein [Trichocoleus sp. FACHB-591]MBD2094258.1 hypothetical protein [Trichocoleus sp. FACHB-591]
MGLFLLRLNSSDEQKPVCCARCIRLSSQVTGAHVRTIDDGWGKGYHFEHMPEHYQVALGYGDMLRQLLCRSVGGRQGAPKNFNLIQPVF